MCKIKYYLFLRKKYPRIFYGISKVFMFLNLFKTNSMRLNDSKNNTITEIKKGLKKSKLDFLTNENDFLVKNLKKAG